MLWHRLVAGRAVALTATHGRYPPMSGCLVRARLSYRATYWTSVFPAVVQCVDGSRTLDVTLVC